MLLCRAINGRQAGLGRKRGDAGLREGKREEDGLGSWAGNRLLSKIPGGKGGTSGKHVQATTALALNAARKRVCLWVSVQEEKKRGGSCRGQRAAQTKKKRR